MCYLLGAKYLIKEIAMKFDYSIEGFKMDEVYYYILRHNSKVIGVYDNLQEIWDSVAMVTEQGIQLLN